MMCSQLQSVRLQALTIVCTIASMAGTSLAQDPEFNEDLDKELEGVKMRVGGGVANAIATALGIAGVNAPAPKVYEIILD